MELKSHLNQHTTHPSSCQFRVPASPPTESQHKSGRTAITGRAQSRGFFPTTCTSTATPMPPCSPATGASGSRCVAARIDPLIDLIHLTPHPSNSIQSFSNFLPQSPSGKASYSSDDLQSSDEQTVDTYAFDGLDLVQMTE